jgi:hypothetical protein
MTHHDWDLVLNAHQQLKIAFFGHAAPLKILRIIEFFCAKAYLQTFANQLFPQGNEIANYRVLAEEPDWFEAAENRPSIQLIGKLIQEGKLLAIYQSIFASDIAMKRFLFPKELFVSENNKTALMIAIEERQCLSPEFMNLPFWNNYSCLTHQDNDGNSALMLAIIREYNALAMALLKRLPDDLPKQYNKEGETPLSIAIKAHNKKFVNWFVDAFCKANSALLKTQDNDFQTPSKLAKKPEYRQTASSIRFFKQRQRSVFVSSYSGPQCSLNQCCVS